ncbi:unnamed protein product [Cuscuta campestris]|uniref:Uncharacterized protein n=1 Tax=Cuscuta campestris TaxID=132261 RepID=A0A484KQJ2_9ASTE|nr:unnamed protein product [Cuscuta campestris]
MTDEEFDQIYSGRGDANLPTLDSLFEDIDEAGLDNLDGDEEPTLHSNDVDVEAGEHETSRGPDKGISRVIRYCTRRNNTSSAPKSKKGFKGIVSGLLAKKGKRALPSMSSRGTIESSHNKHAMYQGVPCNYDEDDVEFDVLGWWKQNEHMFPCIGKLARQVLSVPVSTVAVEREFKAGNNILTDFRSCLNAESLETLVCNQDWLLARRRAQESGAEYSLNTSYDSGLRMSPFQALYGRLPPKMVPYSTGRRRAPVVDEVLRERDFTLRRLRIHLKEAQDRMKCIADGKRRDPEFKVGDLVLLHLQLNRQHSVVRRSSQKPVMRINDPFEVLEHLGPVAYRLKLPATSKVHLVFHVSVLQPFQGSQSALRTQTLPDGFIDSHPQSTPVAVHTTRRVLRNGSVEDKSLVSWSDGTLDDATWEPTSLLR